MMKILKENGLQLGPRTLLHFGVGSENCGCCKGRFRLSLIRAEGKDSYAVDADMSLEQLKDLRVLLDRLVTENK